MHELSAQELLEVWERGATLPPIERSVVLLAATQPATSVDELAQWPIGQRDAQLLHLRRAVFGTHLTATANCLNCQERFELNWDLAAICDAAIAPPPGTFMLAADGWLFELRLPNSLDQAAIRHHVDLDTARRELLARCVVAVRAPDGSDAPDGSEATVSSDRLSDSAIAAIGRRMEELDPLAALSMETACPTCNAPAAATLDIGSFFWSELDAWAQRTLRDIHTLASVYGWRESEILALSPHRRQLYRELIGT